MSKPFYFTVSKTYHYKTNPLHKQIFINDLKAPFYTLSYFLLLFFLPDSYKYPYCMDQVKWNRVRGNMQKQYKFQNHKEQGNSNLIFPLKYLWIYVHFQYYTMAIWFDFSFEIVYTIFIYFVLLLNQLFDHQRDKNQILNIFKKFTKWTGKVNTF